MFKNTNRTHYEFLSELSKAHPDCRFYKVWNENSRVSFVKICHSPMKLERYRVGFKIEKNIMERLSHACLPKYYHVSSTPDGLPYISMEYVRGTCLSDILSQRVGHTPCFLLTPAELSTVCHQIYSTICYLYSHRIQYLDLRPENIIIMDSQFHLKLVDFTFCNFPATSSYYEPKFSSFHLNRTLPEELCLTQAFALFCARLFYRGDHDFSNHYKYRSFIGFTVDSHFSNLFEQILSPAFTGQDAELTLDAWHQRLQALLHAYPSGPNRH